MLCNNYLVVRKFRHIFCRKNTGFRTGGQNTLPKCSILSPMSPSVFDSHDVKSPRFCLYFFRKYFLKRVRKLMQRNCVKPCVFSEEMCRFSSIRLSNLDMPILIRIWIHIMVFVLVIYVFFCFNLSS